MIDLPKATELISIAETTEFLKEKFGVDQEEVDFWLDRLFVTYTSGGMVKDNEITHFEKKQIKEFDFQAEWPLKVPYIYENHGNIISGLEAAVILRKRYNFHKWSIKVLLGTIMSFKNNCSDKHGKLIVNHNLLEPYERLFYYENEINALIPLPEQQIFGFQIFKNRNFWKDFDDQELISFLKFNNQQEKLMVFCPEHFCPGHIQRGGLIGMKQGTPIYQDEWILTGHDGEDAQKLIENQKALFCLADIIAIEDSHFKNSKTKDS